MRELLALVELIKHARYLLIGQPHLTHADHQALIHLQTQHKLSVLGTNLDISIAYVQTLADFLSRNANVVHPRWDSSLPPRLHLVKPLTQLTLHPLSNSLIQDLPLEIPPQVGRETR